MLTSDPKQRKSSDALLNLIKDEPPFSIKKVKIWMFLNLMLIYVHVDLNFKVFEERNDYDDNPEDNDTSQEKTNVLFFYYSSIVA